MSEKGSQPRGWTLIVGMLAFAAVTTISSYQKNPADMVALSSAAVIVVGGIMLYHTHHMKKRMRRTILRGLENAGDTRKK